MQIQPFPELKNILAIAMPFPSVSNLITYNLFAVGKDPITLIDTGPKLPGSFELLERQFALAGLEIQKIRRIIVTHGHEDHFGLATRIREAVEHSVECYIHQEDEWMVSRENYERALWKEGLEELRALVGMPKEEMAKIAERVSFFRSLSDPIEQASLMEEGDEFSGEGYRLRVIHTPGHSPGMCCLYEENEKVLFSGDHLIKHITPNPIMAIRRENLRDPNYQSLKAYRESLDKIANLETRWCFPGHGEFITDLGSIIAGYREHHRQRMDLIWNVLKRKSGPIYYLVGDIFPLMPADDLFLAISEIIVHLEVMIDEGRVKIVDSGPPVLYRAA
jgi:glyoxylase-like metal-dependent hydrolase (beta-lactamase superfamily II)